MIQRVLQTVALLFVSLSFSFAQPLDTTSLSKERYWQQLLHFRDGKSEIDSERFFLSPKGKIDPKAELEATLEAIYHDRSVFCRFPARVKWLYEKIPSLEGYQECQALEDLLESYQASKAVLVFPTAHINSPASMFGHTFLRIDDAKGHALTANAINYAAKTAESNGFLFAYHGLFGGYEGRYSVLPYYKKIKEYNHLERRDIWEYTLNLTSEELERLLTHLYELKDVYADYFFFTENCSYNLLWLLEVARADVRLVELFDFKAIPIDTIRAVEKMGMIEDSHFRPSKTRQIRSIMIEADEARGDLKEAYDAELEVALLQLKRSKNEIEKEPYVKELMRLLQKRSTLDRLPKLSIKEPANPLSSHKSAKLSVGVDEDGGILFGIKTAFHDIYDIERGFIAGAYIDFLHLELKKVSDDGVRLEDMRILNINSYAPRDAVFSPWSWGVSIGVDSFREKNSAYLDTEVGLTYALHENLLGFIMIKPSLRYHDSLLVGTGPKLGLMANLSNMKLGFMGEKLYYSDGKEDLHAEAFVTWEMTRNTALNLKIDIDKIPQTKSEQIVSARLFYYF